MKFKANNGKVYTNRIEMFISNIGYHFTKKKEDNDDELMDFAEFDEDDFTEAFPDDEDDESSNIPDTLVIHKPVGSDTIIVSDVSHDNPCPSIMAFNVVSNTGKPLTIKQTDSEKTQVPPESNGYLSVEGDKNLLNGDNAYVYPAGNETMPKGDGAWDIIGYNKRFSDGEPSSTEKDGSTDILDEEKKPTRRPYELTEEEKKAWVPTNSLLPPQQYFDTVIRRECDKMNINTPSSRSVLYNLNIMVEINGVKMNAAKAMEYAELNDRLINDILYEETDNEPEQL